MVGTRQAVVPGLGFINETNHDDAALAGARAFVQQNALPFELVSTWQETFTLISSLKPPVMAANWTESFTLATVPQRSWINFTGAGYYTVPASSAWNLPNADWCISHLDMTTGHADVLEQVILSLGARGGTSTIVIGVWGNNGGNPVPQQSVQYGQREAAIRDGTGKFAILQSRSKSRQDGRIRRWFYQRTGSVIEMWSCLLGGVPVLESSIPIPAGFATVTPSALQAQIGADSAFSAISKFTGNIGDLWVGSFSLTREEMMRCANGVDISNSGAGGLGKTVSVRYAMETAGATIPDTGGGGHTATLVGSAATTTDLIYVPVTPLQVADFGPNQIFSCPLNGSVTVPLRGRYTGTPSGLEVQRPDGSWTAISGLSLGSGGAFAGGLFEGTAIFPDSLGVWNAPVSVRSADDHSLVSSGANRWGLGILFHDMGQSESLRLADSSGPKSGLDRDNRIGVYARGEWTPTSEILWDGAITACNKIAQVSGRLAGFICSSVGSTSITAWNTIASTYLLGAVTDAYVNGWPGYLSWIVQGASDVGQVSGQRADYLANLEALYALVQTLWPAGTPFGVAVMSNKTQYTTNWTDEHIHTVRQAYYDFYRAHPGLLWYGVDQDISRLDALHPDALGARVMGYRIALGVLKAADLIPYDSWGPTIISYQYVGSTCEIYVQQNGGSALQLAHGGSFTFNFTTGSVASGSDQLTVAVVTKFYYGMPIVVAGAGIAGADLPTYVKSIAGSVVTLQDLASTTVSGANIGDISATNFRFFDHGTTIQSTLYGISASISGDKIVVGLNRTPTNEDPIFQYGLHRDVSNGTPIDAYSTQDAGVPNALSQSIGGHPLQMTPDPIRFGVPPNSAQVDWTETFTMTAILSIPGGGGASGRNMGLGMGIGISL
jgi:hypothetical protein